jgi:uncharacterized cupredoxin-like copper-binding protein
MTRRRIGALATATAVLLLTAQPAAAHRSKSTAAAVVRVTAGKPSEFRFTLSRKSVPVGTVRFVVTNKGNVAHDFKIAGKKTKLLAPGRSQTIVVKFTKALRYRYLCTVSGHRAAGMTGVLQVRRSTQAPARASTDAVTAGKPSEFRFTLSKKTVPHGTVTFTITNRGTLPHDFKIAGKKTALLVPGASHKLRVTFTKPGSYPYLCTVTGHAAAGMKGVLKVT